MSECLIWVSYVVECTWCFARVMDKNRVLSEWARWF